MNPVRVVPLGLVLLSLSACGGADDTSSAKAPSTTTAASQADQEQDGVEAAKRAIKESVGIDPSKTGLAALPSESQTNLRRVAAQMKQQISSLTGIAATGDPDDVTCSEWLSAPEDFTKTLARGLYRDQAAEVKSGGAGRFETKINEACLKSRDGSAMDAISDAIVAAMVGEV